MDIFDKCDEYTLTRELRANDLYAYFRSISSPQDPVVTIGGEKIIMLGSNSYLGLTNHPEVKKAAEAAVAKYGTGCAGSRLLNGTLDIHVELEEKIAEFMNVEAVLTFSTGYQVNVGVISCLLGRHDVAYLDNLNHASIIDGVRLGLGKSFKFKHNDMADLEARLERKDENKGSMIIVDGVFSMRGGEDFLSECMKARCTDTADYHALECQCEGPMKSVVMPKNCDDSPDPRDLPSAELGQFGLSASVGTIMATSPLHDRLAHRRHGHRLESVARLQFLDEFGHLCFGSV